jgi:tyrosyl-tRNA synthetase
MSNYNLIVHGLQEVVEDDRLRRLAEKRPVRVYWGTAPTGRIHVGYYLAILKIAEMVRANCRVIILIADLHAMLDNLKSTEKQIKNRSDYYERSIRRMLQFLRVSPDDVEIRRGSTHQLTPEYSMDVYRLNTQCSITEVQSAGEEVLRPAEVPMMGGLMYPTLQALDEEHLRVDAQLGGVDQRKIFEFARENLPKIGYRDRIHLMTPLVSELRFDLSTGICEKMSSAKRETSIDLLDTRSEIKAKILRAWCPPKIIHDNSVLQLCRELVCPILRYQARDFIIFRTEFDGGPIGYQGFEAVKLAYSSGELCPDDLRRGVVDNLDRFIEPVRREFESREWRQILKHAYERA